MRRWAEFVAALTLLTRLPVARLAGRTPWPGEAASVWAYPVVGALVGGIGGGTLWLAERCGLPAPVGSVLAIAAMLLLTGGLHEDGVADAADGFGGGATVARKLEIMRDSRIGSYGALALMVALAVRGTALASLPPARGMAALIAAGGLGRGAIVVMLLLLRPVRSDGVTAAALRQVRPVVLLVGLVTAITATAALPLRTALCCVVGAVLAAFAVAGLARRQVGGSTGDILGAGEVIAECVVLCIVAGASA